MHYKNGVKMVSKQNRKAENVELSRLIKILGILIMYIRTHLMSGIRLAKNSGFIRIFTVYVNCYILHFIRKDVYFTHIKFVLNQKLQYKSP